eukprot:37308_1
MAFLSTFPGDMMSTYPGDMIDLSSTYDNLIPDCDTYYNMVCNNVLNGYRYPYETICISLGLSVTPQDVQFSNCKSSFDTKMYVYKDISSLPISTDYCHGDGDDCGQCSHNNHEDFIIPALSNSEYTIVLDAYQKNNQGSFQVEINCGDQIQYPIFESTMFSSTNDYINDFICDQTYTKQIYDNWKFSVTGYRNPYQTICIKIYNFPNSDIQFSNCKSTFDTTMVIFEDWSDPFPISQTECNHNGDDCGSCPNGNINRENFILDSLYGTEYTIVLDAYSDDISGGFEVEINTGSYVQYDMFMFSSTIDWIENSEADTTETDADTTLYESTTTNTQSITTASDVTDFSCSNPSNYVWGLFDAGCKICLYNKQAQEICEKIGDNLDEEYKECFKQACPQLKCDFQNIALAENKQGRCDCSFFQCIGTETGNDAYGYRLKMNVMGILLIGVYFVFHSV